MSRIIGILMVTGMLIVASGCSTEQNAEISADSVTREELAGYIEYLASDELAGRGIAAEGGILAEKYMEEKFREFGLQPAFGDKYYQTLTLLRVTPDPEMRLTFTTADGQEIVTTFKEGFVGSSPVPAEESSFEAELVYMGYGTIAERWDWDDYKDFDATGKILLMHTNEPRPDLAELFNGKALTWYGRWTYKYTQAAQKGALGVVLIHSDVDAGYGWNVVQNGWVGDSFSALDDPDVLPLKTWIKSEVAVELFEMAGLDMEELRASAQTREFQPVPMGVRASYLAHNRYKELEVKNVTAVARGKANPAGNNTVILSAHLDHFGVSDPVDGDNIYNGALDNGSALASMLALARVYGENQGILDTDIMFVAVAAEEEGMIGSAYFARNLPVPLERVVANINYEMTSVWQESDDFIALGAEHSDLLPLLEKVGATYNMVYAPDTAPEQGFFYRSDQFSFANEGIPAVWLDCGDSWRGVPAGTGFATRENYRKNTYHRPTDEFDPTWPLAGTLQIVNMSIDVIDELDKIGMELDWNEDSSFKRK